MNAPITIEPGDDSSANENPPAENETKIEKITSSELKRATKRAAKFVHKFTPSALDAEISAKIRMRARLDNLATLYGRWWHAFIQQVPWLSEITLWENTFSGILANSPDAARSKREWKLLRGRITKLSDVATNWTNDGPIVRTEMPFCWKMSEDKCLEGIIDLALFDPSIGRWLILDWKTNRVEKVENLRAQYRPQLAAYHEVIRQMTGHEVEAAIYSTDQGQFLRYERSELETEWNRLKALPPRELLQELDSSPTS